MLNPPLHATHLAPRTEATVGRHVVVHHCECKALKGAARPLWLFSCCGGLPGEEIQPEGLKLPMPVLPANASKSPSIRLQQHAVLCAWDDVIERRQHLHYNYKVDCDFPSQGALPRALLKL